MAKVSIFVGSVYGGAEELAFALAEKIHVNNHEAKVYLPGTVNDVLQATHMLFVTSTTGSGDIPVELESLYLELKDQFPLLTDIPYGIITMGDSGYGDTFCGAGKKIDLLLQELQAKACIEKLDIDACENFEPEEPALIWLMSFIKSF
jgi:flavodoxin